MNPEAPCCYLGVKKYKNTMLLKHVLCFLSIQSLCSLTESPELPIVKPRWEVDPSAPFDSGLSWSHRRHLTLPYHGGRGSVCLDG